MFEVIGLLALALAAAEPLPVTAVSATGHMALKSYTITLVGTAPANGDNDGFADADETIDLAVTLINKIGLDLDGVVAVLSTSSPTIECIGTSQVVIGNVPAGATVTAPPFRFKVGDATTVNRANIDQVIEAAFDVAVRATQFDGLTNPITFKLPLDLSASGGSGASPYVEDFEIGGSNFGKFTLQNLDGGKNSLAASDGMRCQYNDPDAPNTYSAGNTDCFLGYEDDPAAGFNYWHVHAVNAGGYGRAYTGTKSLHWGVHLTSTPARDTTPWKQLDAVKTVAPINVPLSGALPELVFAHQVSMADNRMISSLSQTGVVDRAIVQVNVLTSLGLESPTWRTIEPYMNEYDSVPEWFSNCTFDPTDDGNNEDSYFDPSDPGRFLGPSSTCNPQHVFGRQGDTDYRFPANANNVGRAFDGPGLAGSIDTGTWVRPRFNLQEFAGRKIRVRFLATSIEIGSVFRTWDEFYHRDDLPGDDGWYIDDVRVNAALGVAVTLAADTKTITAIPCGSCSTITAALTATPSATSTPGQPVLLDAGDSSVDVCNNAPLQFQFWIDGNDNGIVGDSGDTLIRDFGPSWTFVDTPESSARIAVVARCLSEPLCDALDGSDTASALVTVSCPTGVARAPFAQTIRIDKPDLNHYSEPDVRAAISWLAADSVDVIQGLLSGTVTGPATSTLKGGGSFSGTVTACLWNNSTPTSTIDSSYWPNYPLAGNAFYYLVRGQTPPSCLGTPAGYTTNSPAERAGRDSEIDADPVAAACP
jgi:hypothetical protein